MFKPQYKQLISVDGMELEPSDVRKSRSITTASLFATCCRISLSSTSEMWYWYGNVLPRSTLLTMLLCLASYEQCSTRLLKMLHKCNTDVLGVLLIYLHSPSGAHRQSNPSLPCYNLLMCMISLLSSKPYS